MAQLPVRQLDEDVKAALQLRARAHGRFTEEELSEKSWTTRSGTIDEHRLPLGGGP